MSEPARTLEPDPLLTSAQLMEMSGMTYRQVDYWTAKGLLVDITGLSGSGRSRRYEHGDVAVARALVDLSKLGMRPSAAGKVAQLLRHGGKAEMNQGCVTVTIDPWGRP